MNLSAVLLGWVLLLVFGSGLNLRTARGQSGVFGAKRTNRPFDCQGKVPQSVYQQRFSMFKKLLSHSNINKGSIMKKNIDAID
jgi:hypothetical protein